MVYYLFLLIKFYQNIFVFVCFYVIYSFFYIVVVEENSDNRIYMDIKNVDFCVKEKFLERDKSFLKE